MVLIKLSSDVQRRFAGKGILSQEIKNFLFALKESEDKVHEPWVVFVAAECSKP